MKFSNFKENILYALDLDGVIIDSIHECYFIGSMVFNKRIITKKKEKELFFKYRGLVGPAAHFYNLFKIIKKYLEGNLFDIEQEYKSDIIKADQSKSLEFEKNFYSKRIEYQKRKFEGWIELNPLTLFGRHLLNKNPKNIIIITAKNSYSASEIINYYKINYLNLFGIEDIEKYGSKGKLLNQILKTSNYQTMYFIDDHVENLQSIDNKKIKCYFANWGYGKNTNFKEYK